MILTKENISEFNLDGFVENCISSGSTNKILIVVPTNRKLRNLKKEIITLSPRRASTSINVETISTLSTRLLENIEDFVSLSEAASSALIKLSSEEIELNYFTKYKDKIPSGTLDRIKNVISEYKKHGISPDMLINEAGGLSHSEKQKALDIAAIYNSFFTRCEKLSALEIGDIYRKINKSSEEEFYSSFNKLFAEVESIVINGFDEFTEPEVKLINKLSSIPKMAVYINFDYYKYNPAVFSHLDKCYSKLLNLGFEKITDTSYSALNPFHIKIRKDLFSLKSIKASMDFSNHVIKFSALNREKEVDVIAKEIKELILKKNVSPSNICVAVNLVKNYSPLIRDLFRVYGIPFNLTDRLSLDSSYPVNSIVNLLEIVENDFYYKDLFRALSSGFVEISSVDLSNLFQIAAKLKIVRGRKNWTRRISEEIEKLKHYDSNENNGNVDLLKKLTKALADINRVNDLLNSFDNPLTIDEFIVELKELIEKINMPKLLLDGSSGREEESIKGISTLFEIITELFDLIKREDGNEAKYTLVFFLEQIRTAASRARFNIKEKSNYGVLVTAVNEIRGLNFEYLFIGGMCEGDFPTRYNPEIFQSGKFFKLEQVHQTEERYHFYQSLCSWSKKLYFSYPQSDNGKELVESNFLKELIKIFNVSGKGEVDYADNVYSKEELLVEFGKSVTDADRVNLKEFQKALNNESNRILHAIKVDKLRNEKNDSGSEFEGVITSTNELAKERLQLFADKQFSVTELETYAKCPFKYFSERLLNLEIIEEPDEEIEAIEIGGVLHLILFEFYSEIRKRKIKINSCSTAKFKETEELLFEIAEKKMENIVFNSPFSFLEREKIFGLKGNRKNSILYKFLEQERTVDDGFEAAYFETSFGSMHKKHSDELISIMEAVKMGDVNLRGKIDRIDVNRDCDKVNVLDYKLGGTKPSKEDLWEGIALQLPVYLYTAVKLVAEKENKNFNPEFMIIYSLKFQKDKFGMKKVNPSNKRKDVDYKLLNEELFQSTIKFINSYVKSIAEGKFNLSKLRNREEKVCRFCQFKSICRVQEVPA
jgi:ATP-dependent helicase/nuclease subunit B